MHGKPRTGPAGPLQSLAIRLTCLLALVAGSAAAATPPVPTKPVASCDATVSGKCYVNGSFTLTSTSAGAHHFRVCRSENTTNWGGCAKIMTANTQMPFTVKDGHVPGDGFRRAYYVSACDASNNCTRWRDNPEVYVQMDLTPPTAPGITTTSPACATGATGPTGCWLSGQSGSFTVNVTAASDSGSGVGAYRHCRSNDSTGGFAGCNVNMTFTGGTSYVVSGSHRPSAGSRRAYRVKAQDRVGNWGPWNSSPVYVRLDYANPVVSASTSSGTATINAHDETGGSSANSGLSQVRYKWDAALNSTCTDGTPTSNGAELQAPTAMSQLFLCARDFTGRVGTWNDEPQVDDTLPQHIGLTISDDDWALYDESTLNSDCEKGNCYDIAVQVSDAHSGVREIRTLINYQGSNAANRRGYFSWRHQDLSYQWSADRVLCTGGGFASKHPTNHGPETVKLVGCTTSLAGAQRTVTFKVRPNLSFGEYGPINDISAWSRDFALNVARWKNYDLNFSSHIATTTVAKCGGPHHHMDELLNFLNTGQVAGLCDWRPRVDFTFHNMTGGRSENLPPLAAAIALFEEPLLYGDPNRDLREYWIDFLSAQVEPGNNGLPGSLGHLKATEMLSSTYDGPTTTAVLAVYYYAAFYDTQEPRAARIRSLAEKYLKATWYIHGLSAGRNSSLATYSIQGNGPARIAGAIGGNSPTLGLAHARSHVSPYDTKMYLFARAAGFPANSWGLSPIKRLVGRLDDDLPSLFATTAADRTALQNLVNSNALPGRLSQVLSGITLVRKMHFMGWADGTRVTYFEGQRPNGNNQTAYAAGYYHQSHFENGRELHLLAGTSGSVSLDANTGTIEHTSGQIMFLPAGSPSFHVVFGPQGYGVCSGYSCP